MERRNLNQALGKSVSHESIVTELLRSKVNWLTVAPYLNGGSTKLGLEKPGEFLVSVNHTRTRFSSDVRLFVRLSWSRRVFLRFLHFGISKKDIKSLVLMGSNYNEKN